MSPKERFGRFEGWAYNDSHPWRIPLVGFTIAIVLTVIICTPIILFKTANDNELAARCAAHGWSLKTVRGGAFCVQEDGVIVEIPER